MKIGEGEMKDRQSGLIDKIKRMESELYIKKSRLASMADMENEEGVYNGLDAKEWKNVFSRLITQIGRFSAGGDSVEDIRMERDR